MSIEENSRYDAVTCWCHATIASGHDMLFDPFKFHKSIDNASKEFGYPYESISSLFRNIHLRHFKKLVYKMRSTMHFHLTTYTNLKKSILSLSKQLNFPPYMMARLVVESIVSGASRSFLAKAMLDPVGVLGNVDGIEFSKDEYKVSEDMDQDEAVPILDPFSGIPKTATKLSRLSREVVEAIDSDPIYGPRHDKDRRIVGYEHEIFLEQSLRCLDVPFETEAQLRIRGTARTPDILLSYPLAVRVPVTSRTAANEDDYDWKVICWIDSKALFGDEFTHNHEVLPQAEAFVHRFGPGLILYWYGHAPLNRLDDGLGDVVVVGYNVPECFMLPNGDMRSFK